MKNPLMGKRREKTKSKASGGYSNETITALKRGILKKRENRSYKLIKQIKDEYQENTISFKRILPKILLLLSAESNSADSSTNHKQVVLSKKKNWEPKTQVFIPDWHNGEYGDMIVQKWQVEPFTKRGYLKEKMNIDMSTSEKSPGSRGLVTWARLWKNYNGETAQGKYIVPYAIQNTVPSEHWQQIHDELDDFTLAMGCVEFVYDPEFSYDVGVHITGENSGGDGCWSYVGVCSGCTNGEPNIQSGWQALRLPNWCVTSGGIHHEFLHAIGYMHEQDRPDYLDWIQDRSDAGSIDPSVWIDTGHPFEPASNVMYSGFTLKNGRSYSPHPLLTTTDAEQGYELYCDAKRDTHPMEPKSMCLHGDHVDVIRPVFQHKFCDGFRDCLNGEDEDGRLAHCGSPELTELGCCAVLNMGFGGATCTADGLVNGKDRYLCENGWGAELRWTTNYGCSR
ncbi:unnamed protein product [Oikopleura dioica]|uniref:Peptidase metallopeptidase domain-containing protein n=1 Tax=Oikopleura dioica TaxID=34765 RepID=E4YN73_OIKDI|nr:unnamed protein product [Oikopleura dioica]